MRLLILILTVAFSTSLLKAQTYNFYASNWKSETSMLKSNSAVFDSKNRMWCVSDGGVYCADFSDNSIKYLRNTDGLATNEFLSIAYNQKRQELILGAVDGTIEIINENTFQITHILDIKNFGLSNPSINDILCVNDTIYFATGYGLSVFNANDNTFITSANQIGEFDIYQPALDLQKNGASLWVLFATGISKIDFGKDIRIKSNWKIFNKNENINFAENNLIDLKFFNNQAFFYSKDNIFKIVDDTIQISRNKSDWKYTGLFELNNELYYSKGWVIKKFVYQVDTNESSDIEIILKDSLIHIYKKVYNFDNEKAIVLHENMPCGYFEGNFKFNYLIPNCPPSNSFNDIKVMNSGEVWFALDYNSSTSVFNLGEWKTYLAKNPNNSTPKRIFISKDGDVYSSFYGGGLGIQKKSNLDSFKFYNEQNSPLTGYGTNPGEAKWVMVGEVKEDKNGVIWALNKAGRFFGPALIAIDKDNNFYPFAYQQDRECYPLVIDFNGVKWYGSNDPNSSGGLYAFYENNTLSNTDDDIKYQLFSSNLTDSKVLSLALDKDSYLWIGTESGVFALINTSCPLTKASPIVRKIKVLPPNLRINCIAIDAVNQKWLGAPNGIWILNADATEIIGKIDKENYPICSNYIRSIAFNNKTGEVYIATDKGLSIFNSLSIQPDDNYSNLKCYPQPFDPIKDENLFIEGMAKGANIKIVTIDGKEITTIETESNKAIWNGKDKNGNIAPNGVYLIISDSKDAGESGLTKISVLKK